MKNQLIATALFFSTLTSTISANCITSYETFSDCLTYFADRGISARFSLLYWKPFTDGMEYAVVDNAFLVTTSAGTAVVLDTDYELKSVNQKAHLGFRLGLNQQINCNCWNVDLQWTHFQVHGHDAVRRTNFGMDDIVVVDPSGSVGQDANDIWSMYNQGNTPANIRGRIKTCYDVIDLTLNNDYCVYDCLTLRALFGLRGAVIVEQLRINYEDPTVVDFDALGLSKMTIRNDFNGIGPVIGIVPSYDLGMGFSLDGLFSISALLGRFNLDTHQKLFTVNAENERIFFEIDREQHPIRLQPNFDLAANLSWQYCYCSCVDFRFSLGYEVNYWINFIRQNRISNRSVNPVVLGSQGKNVEQRHGDLALHGLVFTVDACF